MRGKVLSVFLKSAQNNKILICAAAARESADTSRHPENIFITSEKPTNEMVRRLIPLREQEDRGGSF